MNFTKEKEFIDVIETMLDNKSHWEIENTWKINNFPIISYKKKWHFKIKTSHSQDTYFPNHRWRLQHCIFVPLVGIKKNGIQNVTILDNFLKRHRKLRKRICLFAFDLCLEKYLAKAEDEENELFMELHNM